MACRGLAQLRSPLSGSRERAPVMCPRSGSGALRAFSHRMDTATFSSGPSSRGTSRCPLRSSRLSSPLSRASVSAAANAAAASATAEDCVVVIDNYDSFTYNLCQYLGNLGQKYIVFTNDEKTVEEIRAMNPAGVLVSPGPGRPEDSGISLEIIEKLGPAGIPTFGVCMGHQCIGQVFGGKIIRAPCGVMHGKSSPVFHEGVGVLEGLPNPFQAARYHSLVIDKDCCPEDIVVTAWTEDGTIMACHHKTYTHIQGVQFHPESVITEEGMTIVGNFVKSLKASSKATAA